MTMARFQTYLKDSDVVVTIHRGIDQIGGCITEISTKTSRVFVDFGQTCLVVLFLLHLSKMKLRCVTSLRKMLSSTKRCYILMPMKTMSACLT